MDTLAFDLIVIGAGSTGENVAGSAAEQGLSVAIVERDLVGGDCSYWACMPSKALLRPGEARRAALGLGLEVAQAEAGQVLERRDSFASNWDDSSQVEWVEDAGLTLVRGNARLAGEREVVVERDGESPRRLVARHAVAIATGTDPAVADIPGLRDAEPWTTRDATSAPDVPESLAIIGGGAAACELATAFLDLGSRVTVIARSGLLHQMEPFAGEAVRQRLEERGAYVVVADTERVSRGSAGFVVETDDGDRIIAERLLAATGRRPRTDGLGLDTVGLTDGEYLEVDDTMRVQGIEWLYGVGDVNGRALLTHQGKFQARAAGAVIAARAHNEAVDDEAWGEHVATADTTAVPQVVFSDPQVATVGLTASQAREHGIDARVLDTDLGGVAGAALHRDGYEGKARMVVDRGRGVVVGMTFVGAEVAELLHAATIAVVGEVPLSRLQHAVPAYPTMSEVWLHLLQQLTD